MHGSMRIAGLVALVTLSACAADDPQAERQRDVVERGADVMPFDLDETTHRFSKRTDGVLQTVVADDPTDRTQIELIRAHLLAESEQFGRGEFDDPAAIHGDTMPGLDMLRQHDGRITIDYDDVDDGAAIAFTTEDPALLDALHRWADAQVNDHGDHAEPD